MSSTRKCSDKVGIAGKENAKADSSKALPPTGNRTRKSLIESETPEGKKSPESTEEIGSERSDRVGSARPKGSAR
ncbi:hypothetical protein ACFTXJ_32855, partial [Streptomyces zhihengii]|uniref:hypothetical protein n=1 Tax=Streptomyces zhihengii TaxID=1818004 RepID=UPI00362E441D